MLYCAGDLERPFRRFMVAQVRSGDAVFDVGAGFGLLSLPLARAVAGAGGGAHLHSFEPSPGSAAALRQNLAQNNLSAAADVYELEFGREPLPADAAGRRVTFDDWWRETGRPSMDIVRISGAEIRAVEGMTEALTEARPRIVVIDIEDLVAATGDRAKEVDALLTRLGYRRSEALASLAASSSSQELGRSLVYSRAEVRMPSLPVQHRALGRSGSVDPAELRRRLARRALRSGGQRALALRRPRRWWLVYGPARSGTSYMVMAIRENARLLVADWVLGPALQLPPELPQTKFDRVRARRDVSRNILANARLGGGGPLDLAYKQAWLDLEEYEALVAMWGEPERKVFCYREPSAYMASATEKFSGILSVETIQERYVESLEVFPLVGGDPFEYHPRLTKEDYVEFLSPLVIPNREEFEFRYSGSQADDLVTPRMREAYEDFTHRHGGITKDEE